MGIGMKTSMPSESDALPGWSMPMPESHFVNGHRLISPFPEGTRLALFGMGVFLGGRKNVFGSFPAFTAPPWVMPPASPRIRRTAKSAAA